MTVRFTRAGSREGILEHGIEPTIVNQESEGKQWSLGN